MAPEEAVMGMDRPIKKRRFPIKWMIGAGTILFAVATFFYQVHFTDKSPVIYAKREDLRFFVVRRESFQEFINIIGRVVSSHTSYIYTLETGTVKKLLVEEGDLLSPGQTILILENDQLETALRLKQGRIEEKRIALEMEQLTTSQNKLAMQEELLDINYKLNKLDKEYRKNKKLFNSTGFISRDDFEKIEDAYHYWEKKRNVLNSRHQIKNHLMALKLQQEEIGISILKSEKKRLERRIKDLTIQVAGIGLLTKLEASVGEIKQAGTRIAQFDVIHPLKVEADIDEYYLTKVNLNYEGRFEIEEPLRKKSYYVIVSMIHPEVENNVFTVDLKFKDDRNTNFFIGQTFDIELALGRPREVIIAKKGPFIQDTGGNWVYVVNKSKTRAVKRRIKAGRQNPDYLEVLEGLETGDEIIISRYDGYDNLSEINIR